MSTNNQASVWLSLSVYSHTNCSAFIVPSPNPAPYIPVCSEYRTVTIFSSFDSLNVQPQNPSFKQRQIHEVWSNTELFTGI